MSPLLGAAGGAIVAAGLVLVVAGWRGYTIKFPTRTKSSRTRQISSRLLVAALGVGLLMTVLTRWPVAGMAAGLAVVAAPKFFGGAEAGRREIERLDALAIWIESVRDTIAGAMSLEQAIPATLEGAPEPLREPLGNLVGMLRARVRLGEALERFADELDHPGSDLVVAALILNARLRGPGLVDALSELAVHAREELEQRQIVEAGRVELHRSARILVIWVSSVLVGLALFSSFMEPYSSAVGQVVLAAILSLFGFAFWRLRQLAEYKRPPRFLATDLTREEALR